MVGVSGFEPEASWTRTKRDTKLRHTPVANPLYFYIAILSSVISFSFASYCVGRNNAWKGEWQNESFFNSTDAAQYESKKRQAGP